VALVTVTVWHVRGGEPVREHVYLTSERLPDAGGGDRERCGRLEGDACERLAATATGDAEAYRLRRLACLLAGPKPACRSPNG